eukprot:445283_1
MGNNHKGIAAGTGPAYQYKMNHEMQYKTYNKPLDIPKPIFSIKSIDKSLEKIGTKEYDSTLWEYGIVPFQISEDIRNNCPELEKLILDAVKLCNKSLRNVFWIPMSTYQSILHIDTRKASPPIPSIKFVTADKGCGPASYVGCYGVMKQQEIDVCLYMPPYNDKIRIGNILHEMTHAMGFKHEHARTDRDKYVDIDDEYKHNHNNLKEGVTLGEYDFKSIMHYAQGTCGVRVKKEYSEKATNIGQRNGYSLLDKTGINEIYKNERKKALAIDHGYQTKLTEGSCEFVRICTDKNSCEISRAKACIVWLIDTLKQTYGEFKIISVTVECSGLANINAKSKSFKRTLFIRYLHHPPDGW